MPIKFDRVEHFIAVDQQADEVLFVVGGDGFFQGGEEILYPDSCVGFLCK
jgi:NAD kinase